VASGPSPTCKVCLDDMRFDVGFARGGGLDLRILAPRIDDVIAIVALRANCCVTRLDHVCKSSLHEHCRRASHGLCYLLD